MRQPCQGASSKPARSRRASSSRKPSELPHTHRLLPSLQQDRTGVFLPNTDRRGPGSSARRAAGDRVLGPRIMTAGLGPQGCSGNPSPAGLADLAAPPALPHPWGSSSPPQLSQTQTGYPLPHPSNTGRNPARLPLALPWQAPELYRAWWPQKEEVGPRGVKRGRQAGLRRGEGPLKPLRPDPVPTPCPGDGTAAARNPPAQPCPLGQPSAWWAESLADFLFAEGLMLMPPPSGDPELCEGEPPAPAWHLGAPRKPHGTKGLPKP